MGPPMVYGRIQAYPADCGQLWDLTNTEYGLYGGYGWDQPDLLGLHDLWSAQPRLAASCMIQHRCVGHGASGDGFLSEGLGVLFVLCKRILTLLY